MAPIRRTCLSVICCHYPAFEQSSGFFFQAISYIRPDLLLSLLLSDNDLCIEHEDILTQPRISNPEKVILFCNI